MFGSNPYLLLRFRYFLHSCNRCVGLQEFLLQKGGSVLARIYLRVILECPIRSLVMAILSFLNIIYIVIVIVILYCNLVFFGRNDMPMSCILVLSVVVQILFSFRFDSLKIAGVGVGLGCWFRLLAFSFPSISLV